MRITTRRLLGALTFSCAALILTGVHVMAAQDAAAAKNLVRDPAIAARKLYDAWQAKNRTTARTIASDAAIAKIFAVTPVPMTYHACQRTDVGEFECVYRNAKDDFEVWFKVTGGASAGYHVDAVSLSTD